MAVEHISPPLVRDLLPPLLACLSTANTSKEAPPALLPLLSPILRQRVQLLASDNWLPLLCWDTEVASRLPTVVNNLHVEPHPASGEIEIEDPDRVLYRRSDPETLHARLVLGEFGLVITYLWCTGGEGGSGWRLAELRGVEDEDDGTEWSDSMGAANDAGLRRKLSSNKNGIASPPAITQPTAPAQQDEDDDDAYWAAYDRTPGRTPLQKHSPAPPHANSRVQLGPSQSELEYFARYASEVQPALDAHDPDEESPAVGESTLNGNALNIRQQEIPSVVAPTTSASADASGASGAAGNGYGYDSFPPPDLTEHSNNANGVAQDDSDRAEHIEYAPLNHPRPSSSASSASVEKLEREAVSSSNAELAIKQHISTDMKSLFRLARSAGIGREEFERIVKRELEVLPMLERDD